MLLPTAYCLLPAVAGFGVQRRKGQRAKGKEFGGKVVVVVIVVVVVGL